MNLNIDFVVADYETRLKYIKALKNDLSQESYNIDESCLMDLVLGLNSTRPKMEQEVLIILSQTLKTSSFHKFTRVIPYVLDYMSSRDHSGMSEAQTLFTKVLQCAPPDQKLELIALALQHPSRRTKSMVMKSIVESEIEDKDGSIKQILERLFNESEQPLANQANQLLLRMGNSGGSRASFQEHAVKHPQMVQASSKLAAANKQAEQFIKKCLSRDSGLKVMSTNQLKENLSSSSVTANDIERKEMALINLRSSETDIFTLSPLIRKTLFVHQTSIIKQACGTVIYLLTRKDSSKEVEEFIQPLVRCLDSLSEEVSLYAYVTLKHLIDHYPSSNVLTNIVYNINSKSSRIRKAIGRILMEKLQQFPLQIIERNFMALRTSMKEGLKDEEPEVQDNWRKLIVKSAQVCETMAERTLADIVQQEDPDSVSKAQQAQDEITFGDVKMTDVEQLSSGKFSSVLKGKFLGRTVAVRICSDEERVKKELEIFRKTENCVNFTQLLFKINLPCMFGIFMPHHESLESVVTNKKLQTETAKLKAVYSIAKGLNHIHSLGIIHCGLEPKRIFVHNVCGDFVVKIRNFGRACQETESPKLIPSEAWTDPKTLILPQQFTRDADMYSLGLVAHYVWSGGKSHKDKIHPGHVSIDGDLELSKVTQGMMAIRCLTTLKRRPTAEVTQIFPIFWRDGGYRYFVERLREFFRRSDELKKILSVGSSWKNLVPDELREDSRCFTDSNEHMVIFLRNLSSHGSEKEERRKITGSRNKKLEAWMRNNFQDIIVTLFEETFHHYDDQLLSELRGIILHW